MIQSIPSLYYFFNMKRFSFMELFFVKQSSLVIIDLKWDVLIYYIEELSIYNCHH